MEAKVALTGQQIENIIQTAIQAAMTNALTANGTPFIEAFVRETMAKTDTYGRETTFQRSLRAGMETTVQGVIAKWIEERKEEIRAKTIEMCKASGEKLVADFVARAISVIPHSYIKLEVGPTKGSEE